MSVFFLILAPKWLPNGVKTGGELSKICIRFAPGAPNGRPDLTKDARGAQSHQNGAQSLPNSSKMEPETIKMVPKPPKKSIKKTQKNWRAFCPSHDRKNQKKTPWEMRRNPQPINSSTHPPINQSTNQPIPSPSAVAGLAEGNWI